MEESSPCTPPPSIWDTPIITQEADEDGTVSVPLDFTTESKNSPKNGTSYEPGFSVPYTGSSSPNVSRTPLNVAQCSRKRVNPPPDVPKHKQDRVDEAFVKGLDSFTAVATAIQQQSQTVEHTNPKVRRVGSFVKYLASVLESVPEDSLMQCEAEILSVVTKHSK